MSTDPHFITNENGTNVTYYRDEVCSNQNLIDKLIQHKLLIPDKTYSFTPNVNTQRNNSIKLEDYKSLKLVTPYKMIKCDVKSPNTESVKQQILKQNPNISDYIEIAYYDEYVTVYKNLAVLLIKSSDVDFMNSLICGFFLQSYFSKLQDKPDYIKIANIREFGFLYTN